MGYLSDRNNFLFPQVASEKRLRCRILPLELTHKLENSGWLESTQDTKKNLLYEWALLQYFEGKYYPLYLNYVHVNV